MNKELKPVRCGCGGEAHHDSASCWNPEDEEWMPNFWHRVICKNCGIQTKAFYTEAEAITAWNRAMSVSTEKSSTVERTAKVEEAVPNMTILKRKVDLLSILQAIKTDKIRVWLNYDGKICFQNTKTGNEISVDPYYDMEGNTNNE